MGAGTGHSPSQDASAEAPSPPRRERLSGGWRGGGDEGRAHGSGSNDGGSRSGSGSGCSGSGGKSGSGSGGIGSVGSSGCDSGPASAVDVTEGAATEA